MPRPLSLRVAFVSAVGLASVWLVPSVSFAQTRAAGFVKVLTGSATIVRGGQSLPVKLGDAVQQADTLRTGSDGHLGITLRDETRLSLGPATEVSLTTFAFVPSEKRLGLVLKVVSGIMAFVSGRIAALAPETVHIETPASIIGVRGTHVLVSATPAAPARATGSRTSGSRAVSPTAGASVDARPSLPLHDRLSR